MGVLFTLVDTSMGVAAMYVLEEDRICASIEMSLRFSRPVRGGRVDARTAEVRARSARRASGLRGDERRGDGGDRVGILRGDPARRPLTRVVGSNRRLQVRFMERARGIEPPYRAWEARVLPLNYARRLVAFRT